jgi:preprotein translocase subunit YajC
MSFSSPIVMIRLVFYFIIERQRKSAGQSLPGAKNG